jgi:hypothetical protein
MAPNIFPRALHLINSIIFKKELYLEKSFFSFLLCGGAPVSVQGLTFA